MDTNWWHNNASQDYSMHLASLRYADHPFSLIYAPHFTAKIIATG